MSKMARRASNVTPLPADDERLIAPEPRSELLNGRVQYVPPSDEPHATCHVRLASMLEAHVGPRYAVALDMLTRTSETSDLAPDASIFPKARDRRTGGRRLEEIAFEILSTERIS